MGSGADGFILIIYFAIAIGVCWAFYKWGASIAEKKGYSRNYGWWAVFFGFLAILILALMPSQRPAIVSIPSVSPRPKSIAEQLEQLATLHESGALTTDEYELRKRGLLSGRH